MKINRLITIIWQALMGVLAFVGLLITQYSEEIGLMLCLIGLISCFLTGFSWTRIVDELGYGDGLTKFIKVINYIIGWIGLILLTVISLFSFFIYSMDQMENVAMSDPDKMMSGMFMACFAMCSALVINALLRNFVSLFPSLKDTWPRIFFEDYGYMILLMITLGSSLLLLNNAPSYAPYVLMLLWNFTVLFLFVFMKCRYEKVWVGYVMVVITAIIDIISMIVMASEYGADTEFTKVLMSNTDGVMFKFTCLGYFLIALLICGPLYFIIEKAFDNLPRGFRSIVFFVVPLIAIPLQILMYYYWYIALIGAVISFVVFYIVAFFTAKGGYYDTIYYCDGDYYVVRTYY